MITTMIDAQEHVIESYEWDASRGVTLCGLLILPSHPGPSEASPSCSLCLTALRKSNEKCEHPNAKRTSFCTYECPDCGWNRVG